MFTLPELKYQYTELEPHIDATTMEIHHTKHHQAYITKLNEAIDKHPELANKTIEELLRDVDTTPEDIQAAIKNHGGGHHNHSLFWNVIGPKETQPSDVFQSKISSQFESYEKFKSEFTENALSRFGSGWSWLVKTSVGDLKLYSLPNQDSPITLGDTPLLGLDVWEHAYYLNYQNRRADYVNAFWNIVNWPEVEKNYLN